MADSTAPAPGHGTDAAHTLRGHIGIPGVVFLVVAAAAPLTVVAGALPVMLAIANGPGAPMAYVVVAVVLLLFSVGYAAMSHHIVDAGAFYAYVTRGLGAAPMAVITLLVLTNFTTLISGSAALAAVLLLIVVAAFAAGVVVAFVSRPSRTGAVSHQAPADD